MREGLYYSEDALRNRTLFLADFSDIVLFVEDVDKEFEYEVITQRLFADELKIRHIFPQGGKPGVEKAFQKYGEEYEGKVAIYLVDGDFDIMLEKNIVENPHYIYLEKYNIESYFIDHDAVVTYMVGQLKKCRADVISIIKYEEWEENVYPALTELFLNYVIAQSEIPEEENVGRPPLSFMNDKGDIIDERVNAYTDQLKEKIENYDDLYRYYKQRFENVFAKDSSRLICGKYLLASLARYLRNKGRCNFKNDDMRYDLVRNFDIHKLDYLKNRILELVTLAPAQEI